MKLKSNFEILKFESLIEKFGIDLFYFFICSPLGPYVDIAGKHNIGNSG
jgi:hypothetical protein